MSNIITEQNIAARASVLKPERDKHVRNRHPWVFMGAVAHYPEFENGDLLPVVTSFGDFVGYGYFHKGQSIVGRMISFTATDPKQVIVEHIKDAIALRHQFMSTDTTAYRLINGEGDSLPGLIVDLYGDVLVLQINTLGIEKLKPLILETLQIALSPRGIYEKSKTPTRRKEGLDDFEGWLVEPSGETVQDTLLITENGLKFSVSLNDSQKTGMFLDQRGMRALVGRYSKSRTVLNCFSYTGGFSVYALAGGAKRADSVDLYAQAIAGARTNVKLNGFSEEANGFYAEDVFTFLAQKQLPQEYDFIILDPPAFAKRASDIPNASRGYREINRLAMEKLPKGGLLLTSSCSAHVDRALFQTLVFQAAKDAKRNVRILSYHILGADHPVSLYYPEGDYLKSLLLYIN